MHNYVVSKKKKFLRLHIVYLNKKKLHTLYWLSDSNISSVSITEPEPRERNSAENEISPETKLVNDNRNDRLSFEVDTVAEEEVTSPPGNVGSVRTAGGGRPVGE